MGTTITTTTSTTEIPDAQGQDPAMLASGPVPGALKRFIWDIQSMVELADSEREILLIGRDLMTRLVASDDWLAEIFAKPDPARCQQFQLYHDDQERFTVVSTILAPGQGLPIIEDQVWRITGVLRGSIERARFDASRGTPQPQGAPGSLQSGNVETTSAKNPVAVQMRNALGGGVSICIDVYGGEISSVTRKVFAPDGQFNEEAVVYANPHDAPAYDILSIQTRIVD